MKIRDRIKELRRVPAKDLIPNKKNWRRHPKTQIKAMNAVLKEIGFADALLARENKKGELVLIDGHMRADLSPDTVVPVLVLDLSEKEAEKMLATSDPIAAMAETDWDALTDLADSIDFKTPEFGDLLKDIALDEPKATDPESVGTIGDMEYRIIIECASEHEQARLLDRFATDGLKCKALVS